MEAVASHAQGSELIPVLKTNPDYYCQKNSLNFIVAVITILGDELRALWGLGQCANTELPFQLAMTVIV